MRFNPCNPCCDSCRTWLNANSLYLQLPHGVSATLTRTGDEWTGNITLPAYTSAFVTEPNSNLWPTEPVPDYWNWGPNSATGFYSSGPHALNERNHYWPTNTTAMQAEVRLKYENVIWSGWRLRMRLPGQQWEQLSNGVFLFCLSMQPHGSSEQRRCLSVTPQHYPGSLETSPIFGMLQAVDYGQPTEFAGWRTDDHFYPFVGRCHPVRDYPFPWGSYGALDSWSCLICTTDDWSSMRADYLAALPPARDEFVAAASWPVPFSLSIPAGSMALNASPVPYLTRQHYLFAVGDKLVATAIADTMPEDVIVDHDGSTVPMRAFFRDKTKIIRQFNNAMYGMLFCTSYAGKTNSLYPPYAGNTYGPPNFMVRTGLVGSAPYLTFTA